MANSTKDPIIVTTHIKKGGTGKTTITYNGAFFLAIKKDLKVLVIDLDPSGNMTARFKRLLDGDLDYTTKNTVWNIFAEKETEPIPVAKNIDLICGNEDYYDLEKQVEKDGRGRQQLRKWFFRNREMLIQYDYILIDTHNDFSLFTENALVLSDLVLTVAEVDEDSMKELEKEEEKIERLRMQLEDVATGESPVVAKVIKVGNKVQTNTGDSHKFQRTFNKLVENPESGFYGYFDFRVYFAKTKTTAEPLVVLESRAKTKGDKEFFKRTWALYEKIYNVQQGA